MNEIVLTDTIPMDFAAIQTADLAASTKIKYTTQIKRYLEAGGSFTDSAGLFAWANNLGPSSRLQFKAALTLLTKGLELDLKASATPENIAHIQAAVYRIEAMNDSVVTKKTKSTKLGKWISARQVTEIYDEIAQEPAPIARMRNLVLAKLLFKTGCRRDEVTQMTFQDLSERSHNGASIPFVQIHGKGRKERAISLENDTTALIKSWHETIGDGYIIRRVRRGDVLVDGQMNPNSIRYLVQVFGKSIGEPDLSAHDTRRTFAELLRQAGVPIEIISRLLGHETIETTVRYLELNGDVIKLIPGDYIP